MKIYLKKINLKFFISTFIITTLFISYLKSESILLNETDENEIKIIYNSPKNISNFCSFKMNKLEDFINEVVEFGLNSNLTESEILDFKSSIFNANIKDIYKILTTDTRLSFDFRDAFSKEFTEDRFTDFYEIKLAFEFLNFSITGEGSKSSFPFSIAKNNFKIGNILTIARKFLDNYKSEIVNIILSRLNKSYTKNDLKKYNINESNKKLEYKIEQLEIGTIYKFLDKFIALANKNQINFDNCGLLLKDLSSIKENIERVFYCEEFDANNSNSKFSLTALFKLGSYQKRLYEFLG